MSTPALDAIVERIRSEQRLPSQAPGFDPQNGNERAKYLFVLAAPGPQALKTGMVSFDNPDRTASNFRAQLREAGVVRSDIAIWNVVPWYLGNQDRTRIRGALASDAKLGLGYLDAVIRAITGLRCVVLVGGAARRAHIRLSYTTKARILSCHHRSPKVQNTTPAASQETVAVCRVMQTMSQWRPLTPRTKADCLRHASRLEHSGRPEGSAERHGIEPNHRSPRRAAVRHRSSLAGLRMGSSMRKAGIGRVRRVTPASRSRLRSVAAQAGCPNSRWCRNAACRGARLVFDHSSSISHFTASSFFMIASSSGSGQASSIRCPLGSKK